MGGGLSCWFWGFFKKLGFILSGHGSKSVSWSLHESFYRKQLLNIYDIKLHIQHKKYWKHQVLNAFQFQAIYFTLATNFMWLSEECLNGVHFRKHASRLKRIRSPLCIQHQRQKIDWCVLLNFFSKILKLPALFVFLNKTQFNKGLILPSKTKPALTMF